MNRFFIISSIALLFAFTFNILFSNGTLIFSSSEVGVIFYNFRLPKAINAFSAGAVLSIAGLIMQNIFKNPLAGPDVLGISQGASLAVALSVLAGIGFGGIGIMAVFGAFAYLFFLLWVSKFVHSAITLLLIGVMGGFVISAFISTLEVFSNAERLKSFVMWNMGSFSKSSLEQAAVWALVLPLVLLSSIILSSKLDVLLLGNNQAQLLGINSKKVMFYGIIIAGVSIGTSIALCGPVAFVGLIAPHLAKWLLKTYKHKVLIAGSAIIGGTVCLLADFLSTGVFGPVLPLNATLSILAAPIILFVVLKRI